MDNSEKITTILRHIKRVEDNCNKLAMEFQETDLPFALKLIQLGRQHDISKFNKFEFDYLGNFEKEKPVEFFEALKRHHSNNPHHPEYWNGGILSMPNEYVAEMVCDCVARGQEFGTDTRYWFENEAIKKYDFSMKGKIGSLITKYLDILLTKPFNKQ